MSKPKLVLIGASTGGPGHLKRILKDIPKDTKVPIIIAQHMGALFIPSFAQQFKSELNANVYRIDTELRLDSGGIFICERNTIVSKNLPLRVMLEPTQSPTTHNPNIDILFSSAVNIAKDVSILTILLTGIGADGALGMQELDKAGAVCIGENEESAVVYGMPKRAKELIPSLKMLSLQEIKEKLELFINDFF